MSNAYRRNNLAKVKINGVCLIEVIEIREGIVWAFQNLLSEPREWHPNIKEMNFDTSNR